MTIDCDKCPEKGSCCGPFQMKKDFVEKHKTDFQVIPEKTYEVGNTITFLTSDFGCVFLNRTTKKCSIYDDRPEVCKLYGISKDLRLQCPYFKPSGNPRSEASRKKVQKFFDRLIDNIMEENKWSIKTK